MVSPHPTQTEQAVAPVALDPSRHRIVYYVPVAIKCKRVVMVNVIKKPRVRRIITGPWLKALLSPSHRPLPSPLLHPHNASPHKPCAISNQHVRLVIKPDVSGVMRQESGHSVKRRINFVRVHSQLPTTQMQLVPLLKWVLRYLFSLTLWVSCRSWLVYHWSRSNIFGLFMFGEENNYQLF